MEVYTPRPSDQARRVYALNMRSALYEEVRQAAAAEDLSIAQWVRQAIKAQLPKKPR